ncbi:MAG TPA: recombinase RecT [Stellaceae bacterium]|nr:recombinase RecT [Stellaceae bacterium]
MPDDTALPKMADPLPDLPALPTGTMSPAIAIMLDEKLFERAKQIATYLSRAEGFTPPHLIGKVESCFAVVTRSLTWKLDPYAVAQSTYQTPGGKVGYEGKLCQAILENSGKLDGPVKYEFYGDWSKVQGKFKIQTSQKGTKYPAPSWHEADEIGLGVIVRAQVHGEAEPRELRFDLVQAFPRNSTLWATDPKTQLCYAAVRRFGSVAAPGLFMGVPFDREDFDPALHAKDVTPPRPQRSDFVQRPAERHGVVGEINASRPAAPLSEADERQPYPGQDKPYFFTDDAGEIREFDDPGEAAAALQDMIAAGAKTRGIDGVEAAWENGARLMSALRGAGRNDLADALSTFYGESLDQLRLSERSAQHDETAGPADGEPQPAEALYVRPPAAAKGGTDWPKYVEDLAAAARKLPLPDFAPFRVANAKSLQQLRLVDRAAWEGVTQTLADLERALREKSAA